MILLCTLFLGFNVFIYLFTLFYFFIGIPRSKRGEVWIFLAEQFCSKMAPPVDTNKFPRYNCAYEQLLKELTSQQHAILIDLGKNDLKSVQIY